MSPVPAQELRPRTAISLFDAALRLCARSSGLWALTLPGGAVVTGALLHLYDAGLHQRPLLLPSLLFTLAWFFRASLQGAACHYVSQVLFSPEPASTERSLKAALHRLPSLFVTASVLAAFYLVTLPLTFGLSFFFIGTHLVAYSVTMQGVGSPLGVLQSGSTLLGAARGSAVKIRWLFTAQIVLLFNLHVAVLLLLQAGSDLLGLDLAFTTRFVSLDNTAWWVVLIAVTFSLTEPMRAAVAGLLLVDGRVRQEGLDLLSAIEQLPRRKPKPVSAASALLFLACLAGPARAESLEERLQQLVVECRDPSPELRQQLRAARELPEKDNAALRRLVEELESTAYGNDDCETAMEQLHRRAPLLEQTRDAWAERHKDKDAADQAKEILNRSEFSSSPERPPAEKATDDSDANDGWTRFWKAVGEWLKKALENKDQRRTVDVNPMGAAAAGASLAHLLVVVLIAAVVGLLLHPLVRSRGTANAAHGAEITTSQQAAAAATTTENALSRPPEGWAQWADELAARGQFREAVRGLYLALLARLHHDGAIDYDPALSNWDYFRQFRGGRERLTPFRELTYRFDFTYYGNLGVSAEGYATFRQLTAPFLVTQAPLRA
ncbi:MAG: DUF4129 domain-containing protein [Myxococcaceae bacterium]